MNHAARRRTWLAALYAAIALAAPVAARAALPRLAPVPCPFKAVTGLPCTACGSGRALAALGNLRFGPALAANPLLVAGLAALALWPLAELLRPWLGARAQRSWMGLPELWLRIGLGAALIANWVYLIAAGR